MAQKPCLGYWEIRGLAAPLRYILAYAGEDYDDVRYKVGDGPTYDRSHWFDVKFTLGLAFPNLPYYMDDKVKLTETNAIFRHLGRKYNLYGDDEVTKANVDQILESTMDLRNGFVRQCYGPNFDTNKPAYLEASKKKFEQFEAFLGDKLYFAGNKVTVCDFHIFEMIDQHKMFDESVLKECPKLLAFWQRFSELPAIKAYMAKAAGLPVNNKMAGWK